MGSNDAEDQGLKRVVGNYEKDIVERGGRITYCAGGNGWAAFAGSAGATITYHKSLLRRDRNGDQIIMFEIRYPRAEAAAYAPIVERISRCFTIACHPPF